MAEEPKKRPRRTPLSPEDVAHIIAVKRWREFKKRERLKKSKLFKALNVFNVVCIFVYFELLFCYLGPCNYQVHYAHKLTPHYGYNYHADGRRIISEIDVLGVNGSVYNFIVNDYMDLPPRHVRFVIGKDFLLQKSLKGLFENSDRSYRLFSASPVLFLCLFVASISLFAFLYNLNEKAYSLNALTVLNLLTFVGILCI